MNFTLQYRVIVAIFFLLVITTPVVTQHCLALDHSAIEWTEIDDSEKESSKKLLDDLSKDWISYGAHANGIFSFEELSGLNAGYFLNPQRESFTVILDPPEYF